MISTKETNRFLWSVWIECSCTKIYKAEVINNLIISYISHRLMSAIQCGARWRMVQEVKSHRVNRSMELHVLAERNVGIENVKAFLECDLNINFHNDAIDGFQWSTLLSYFWFYLFSRNFKELFQIFAKKICTSIKFTLSGLIFGSGTFVFYFW